MGSGSVIMKMYSVFKKDNVVRFFDVVNDDFEEANEYTFLLDESLPAYSNVYDRNVVSFKDLISALTEDGFSFLGSYTAWEIWLKSEYRSMAIQMGIKEPVNIYVRAEHTKSLRDFKGLFDSLMRGQDYDPSADMIDGTLYMNLFAFEKTKCSFDATENELQVLLAYHMKIRYQFICVDLKIVNENGDEMPIEFEKIGEWLGGSYAESFFEDWKDFALEAGWYKEPTVFELREMTEEPDSFF